MVVSSLRPSGVLIADDEEAICFSLSRELRRRGLTVYVAANGEAALELFRTHEGDIDAVFLDVRMPRLDGPQTLTAMRQLVPGIRCCFMTAFFGVDQLHDTSEPVVEVLKKPFDLSAFLQVVERLLNPKLEDRYQRLQIPVTN